MSLGVLLVCEMDNGYVCSVLLHECIAGEFKNISRHAHCSKYILINYSYLMY